MPMNAPTRIFDRSRLLLLLSLLLGAGFFATTLFGYFVSRETIRAAIISQDLPLTSSNIYSEIQKDLVRPVLISSTMANDTFLRDWVVRGERGVDDMARYLKEVKDQYRAFSSFFVSERTRNYYTGGGVLKRIGNDDPHDIWYFRMRDKTAADYEIDVDTDQANKNALTIFINYRVKDFDGRYIGVTGIGLTVDAVKNLIELYQERFRRTIYFVDRTGNIVLFGEQSGLDTELRNNEGVGPLVDNILASKSGSWQYRAQGSNHILNVNYLPELKWYLFVEQNEDLAMAEIRQTLYINLAISLVVSVLIILLARGALIRYQTRIEELASTDELTGLLNRHAFSILQERLLAVYRREQRPLSVLLVDVDHFKSINDRYGHLTGDRVLERIGQLLKGGLRESDLAVRWGGEEFLLVLQGCAIDEAVRVAEQLREAIAAARPCADTPDLNVTISVGIGEFDGLETFEQTIDRADQALYAAKAAGRDRVCRAAPNPAA